jgi:hypothetical protein
MSIVPIRFRDDEGIQNHFYKVRDRLISHPHNFRSFGNIPVETLDRVMFNPQSFREVGELLDKIPLTDFNVDMVVSHEGEIVFYHQHQAMDRLSVFEDHDLGA